MPFTSRDIFDDADSALFDAPGFLMPDPDREIIFVGVHGANTGGTGDGAILAIDFSDPDNLTLLGSISDPQLDDPWGMAYDANLQILFVVARDAVGSENNDFGHLVTLDVSDVNAMSVLDTWNFNDNTGLGDFISNVEVDPVNRVGIQTRHDGDFVTFTYTSGGLMSTGDRFFFSNARWNDAQMDPSRQIGWVHGPNDLVAFDYSTPTNINVLWQRNTEDIGQSAHRCIVLFPDDDLLAAIFDTPDFEVAFFDISPVYTGGAGTELSRVTFSEQPRGLAGIKVGGVPHVFVVNLGSASGSNVAFRQYELSDPNNPTLVDTFNKAAGYHRPRSIQIDDARRFVHLRYEQNDGSPGDIGAYEIIEASVTAVAPDKPTLTIPNVTDRTLDMQGSAYSHPESDPHADSQWQVVESSGAFSAPDYDATSGGPKESHEATALTPDTQYKARMRYQGDNGLWSEWSDTVTVTTEGEPLETTDVSLNVGPRGFFFGASQGNHLEKFGEIHTEEGGPVEGTIQPNPVAPAGPDGECIFRNVYLTIGYGTDVTLVLTPILDGTEITDLQRTVTLTTASNVEKREEKEIPLLAPQPDAAGEVSRQALRGTWITFKLTVKDTAGKGPPVFLEGAVLEGEVVRESTEAESG